MCSCARTCVVFMVVRCGVSVKRNVKQAVVWQCELSRVVTMTKRCFFTGIRGFTSGRYALHVPDWVRRQLLPLPGRFVFSLLTIHHCLLALQNLSPRMHSVHNVSHYTHLRYGARKSTRDGGLSVNRKQSKQTDTPGRHLHRYRATPVPRRAHSRWRRPGPAALSAQASGSEAAKREATRAGRDRERQRGEGQAEGRLRVVPLSRRMSGHRKQTTHGARGEGARHHWGR